MAKKLLGVLTALALVGGVLSAATASAQEAPPATVPENPNIVDPQGDARAGLPAGPSFNGADVLAAWFTHDAETISAHVQTVNDARPESMLIDVGFDPGVGAACMYIDAVTSGSNNDARVELYYEDDCGDQGAVPVEGGTFAMAAGPEDTVINTITIPRSADPAFEDGKKLATPFVTIWNNAFDAGAFGQLDTTDPGTDYEISQGGPSVDPGDPPKVDPPVKKGCKKGKGKKKGCKKPACPAFTPAEGAGESPITVVKDTATEAAPLEIPVTAGAGTPEAPTTVFQNLQVDTKSKESLGLYVRYEFPSEEDMDLYLLNPDGATAAQAAGFNPFPFVPQLPVVGGTDGTGTGGHSEQGAEQVDGVLTPDCGGYSAQIDSFLSAGGDHVMKVWLGPATWDPVAQAPIEDEG